MSKPLVYIDGQEGTTGLQIYDRLGGRDDLELLRIDPEKRKDPAERKRLLNRAEIAFLCLPDDAAREAVSLVENDRTRIIDASTAHRTASGWAYGFPELSPAHRAAVIRSKRVANPGCHASGFLAVVYPLVALGILPKNFPVTCFSLTGYSGGGKKMIASYEGEDKGEPLFSPRIYGLEQSHKHLPEMHQISGLETAPIFCPVVDDFYKGMATTVPLHTDLLPGSPAPEEIWEKLSAYYEGQKLVTVAPLGWNGSMIAANTLAGTDRLELIVCGRAGRVTVTALFDNLGKGASGAAVQNMNLMLGLEETTGLAF